LVPCSAASFKHHASNTSPTRPWCFIDKKWNLFLTVVGDKCFHICLATSQRLFTSFYFFTCSKFLLGLLVHFFWISAKKICKKIWKYIKNCIFVTTIKISKLIFLFYLDSHTYVSYILVIRNIKSHFIWNLGHPIESEWIDPIDSAINPFTRPVHSPIRLWQPLFGY